MSKIAKTAIIHDSAQIGANVTIKDFVVIHRDVVICDNVEIGIGTIIKENVKIESNSYIGDYSILGEYSAEYYNDEHNYERKQTVIGENSLIRSNSIIYENVQIGREFQTGHRVTIRECSYIGDNCSIGTLCDIQGYVKIGDFVRMHSNVHIGQKSIIENYVWIYPYVVLTNDPYPPMGKLKGVTLKEYSQVATLSVVMPGVTVGINALVGANSLVRKDVPDESVYVGNPGKIICSIRDLKDDTGNQIYPWKEYLTDFRGYPWQKNKSIINE